LTVSRETSDWRSWPEKRVLIVGARRLNLDLTPEQTDRLLDFMAELRRWNRKINLIGPARPPEDLVLHLLDSLAPLPYLPAGPLRLLDLGSGAGLPGLVLKILRPDWTVTLAEARAKRAAFLRQAGRLLRLDGLEVIQARLGPDHPEPPRRDFDLVTARAFGPLTELLPLAAPFLKTGGRLLAYKGPKADREPAAALNAEGFQLESRQDFRLPFLDRPRVVLLFRFQ